LYIRYHRVGSYNLEDWVDTYTPTFWISEDTTFVPPIYENYYKEGELSKLIKPTRPSKFGSLDSIVTPPKTLIFSYSSPVVDSLAKTKYGITDVSIVPGTVLTSPILVYPVTFDFLLYITFSSSTKRDQFYTLTRDHLQCVVNVNGIEGASTILSVSNESTNKLLINIQKTLILPDFDKTMPSKFGIGSATLSEIVATFNITYSESSNSPPPGTLPRITVTYPNGGETLAGGSVVTITWTSDNLTEGKLRIFLYNGYSWLTVVNNLSLTVEELPPPLMSLPLTSYSWTVPSINSNNCKIKVENYDPSTDSWIVYDISDGNFTINSVPPSVPTLSSPANGAQEYQLLQHFHGLLQLVLLQ